MEIELKKWVLSELKWTLLIIGGVVNSCGFKTWGGQDNVNGKALKINSQQMRFDVNREWTLKFTFKSWMETQLILDVQIHHSHPFTDLQIWLRFLH